MRFWILALAGLTVLRLLLAAVSPLSPDETYYFLWAAHLQAGYYDHPPMVALLIRAGTALFGPDAFGVRVFGPVLAALGSILLWRAGEDFFPDRHAGIIAAALFNATIIMGVGCLIMTPDTPLLFFWTAALAAMGRWFATRDGRWWLAIGALAGTALLSKYTAALLIAGIGFFLLSGRDGRRALKTPWPWAGLALAALVFLPNLQWNAAHGWISYFKQGGRVAQFDPSRAAQFLAELVFGQIGLITPLIFFLAARGLWRLRGVRSGPVRLVLWLSLLPVAVFLQHVLSDRVQANWPAILLPAAFLAAGSLPAAVMARWLRPALWLGLGCTSLVYAQALAAPFPIPAGADPVALQLAGWQGMVAKAAAMKPVFMTSDDYATTAELAFYAPRRIPVTGFGARWQYFGMAPATSLNGKIGIMVTRRADAFCPHPLGSVTRQRGGDVVATYRLCPMLGLPDMVLLPRR